MIFHGSKFSVKVGLANLLTRDLVTHCRRPLKFQNHWIFSSSNFENQHFVSFTGNNRGQIGIVIFLRPTCDHYCQLFLVTIDQFWPSSTTFYEISWQKWLTMLIIIMIMVVSDVGRVRGEIPPPPPSATFHCPPIPILRFVRKEESTQPNTKTPFARYKSRKKFHQK